MEYFALLSSGRLDSLGQHNGYDQAYSKANEKEYAYGVSIVMIINEKLARSWLNIIDQHIPLTPEEEHHNKLLWNALKEQPYDESKQTHRQVQPNHSDHVPVP